MPLVAKDSEALASGPALAPPSAPPRSAPHSEVLREFEKDYDDIRWITEGGSSHIWLMRRRNINQWRILKVLKVDETIRVEVDGHPAIERSLGKLFKQEIAHILAISNAHVIRLYEAGDLLLENGRTVPWYLMEYLEDPQDVHVMLRGLLESGRLQEDIFVEYLSAIVDGISACHDRNIVHCDLKPENIQVAAGGEVRITDFGFAKALLDEDDSGSSRGLSLWIGTRDYMHPELQERLANQRRSLSTGRADDRITPVALEYAEMASKGLQYDLYALGKTIGYLLEVVGVEKILHRHRDFLRLAVKRLELTLDRSGVARYETIGAFRKDLRKLRSGWSLEGEFEEFASYPSAVICIPLCTRLPRTPRVERLLNQPLVQRMNGIRQLGLTCLFYPGATHSRLEHSMGVFQQTVQYVQALWQQKDFRYFAQVATTQDINALLVAALLHDAGHFPLAHAFEEVTPTAEQKLHHEELGTRLLAKALGVAVYEHEQCPEWAKPEDIDKLNDLLRKDWLITLSDVLAVLTGVRSRAVEIQADAVPLLHGILNGPLDADKLDYLRRDSIHTGNPAGQGIEVDRLLRNLVVADNTTDVGIRDKGVTAAESLFFARYEMYKTVYWHRTNRAIERMVTEAAQLAEEQSESSFTDDLVPRLFGLDEDGLLQHLSGKIDEQSGDDLIRPLTAMSLARDGIYKRLLTVSTAPTRSRERQRDASIHQAITSMFADYIEQNTEKWRYQLFELRTRLRLLSLVAQSSRGHEVVIDVPDPRVEAPVRANEPSRPRLFMVYGSPTDGNPVEEHSPLFGAYLREWRMHARKVRIFCSPRVEAQLRSRIPEVREIVAAQADECKRRLPGELIKTYASSGDIERTINEFRSALRAHGR